LFDFNESDAKHKGPSLINMIEKYSATLKTKKEEVERAFSKQ